MQATADQLDPLGEPEPPGPGRLLDRKPADRLHQTLSSGVYVCAR
jgi:hypothetical protein